MHVVLAGGGTAGHTSPLIATAEALLGHPGVTVSCIGTARGLETTVVPAAGLALDLIDPVPLPRSVSVDLARLPWRLGRSVAQARAILKRREAGVLVGFGGYVSSPAYLAAASARVPILIHEQNSVPGIANRLGARLGGRVAITFPDTPFPGARYLGMPLRRQVAELARLDGPARAAARAEARRALGLTGERRTLLVSGGSQGARSINQATELALPDLLGAGFDVIHVWGPKNASGQERITVPASGATYLPLAYVDRMEQAYAAADLMVGRSGAGTVCEAAAVGLPGLFVPLPHGNGEQARNARALVAAGGAVLVDDAELTGERLRTDALGLLRDPERLAAMAAAGRGLVPGDAAERLAAWALEVAR